MKNRVVFDPKILESLFTYKVKHLNQINLKTKNFKI